MNNMIGFLYVNTETDCNRRENNHPKSRMNLEIIDQPLAAILTITFSAGITVNNDRAGNGPNLLIVFSGYAAQFAVYIAC
ncbi:Uncharacterised protein [Klebsiella pneumoniae]|nr:Uncharacterised protein [Klebsiella pneumoniae]